MSRISQDFINKIGYLYEEMSIQENDFLNEESQYYDAEATELVEDILSTISVSMVYEGYSAEGIIGFLADSSEQDIVEKYLSFDENILTESTISEDYIADQLEIFDIAIEEGIGSLIGKVAKGALGLAGRIASKPARSAVAKKIMQSSNPTRTIAAVERLAAKKVAKAGLDPTSVKNAPDIASKVRMGVTAPIKGTVTKAVQKVKDVAKGAKAALTSPTAKRIAKGAGIFGLGAAGGFVGAKMAGAGSDSKPPKPSKPSKTQKPSDTTSSTPSPTPPKPSPAPTRPSSPSTPSSPSAPSKPSGTPSKPSIKPPVASGQTGDKVKDMETWAKANPKLAAKVKPGQAGYDVISKMRDKPSSYEKQDQTPTQGSPTAKIDTKSVEADIEADKKRQQEKMKEKTNESYEPYDILLDYLMGTGHADTIEEAHYIMLEMDETAVGTIIEAYNDYVLAEEISEWVDALVNEGYDLSEYTWDDMTEYYVNEVRV